MMCVPNFLVARMCSIMCVTRAHVEVAGPRLQQQLSRVVCAWPQMGDSLVVARGSVQVTVGLHVNAYTYV